MEQVRRSLQEFEDKATKVKNVLSNKYGKIKLERTKADIRTMQHQLETDKAIAVDRASLDKEKEKEHSEFVKKMEKEHVALMKNALSDQHALFARMIAHDRVIANEVLQKTREENYDNLQNLQKTIDTFNDQARAQVQELENHCSMLKSLVDNLIPLIEPKKDYDNLNVEVQYDMISMPRLYFNLAVDNYCAPHLAMKFKVCKLEELYYDLQKYDLRARLGEFAIEGRYVKFHKFITALTYHGYILDAEVYYLNPAPGSKPSTDLVKIVGQEDVKQMVRAHAQQGTKICLLYLVSRYEDQAPNDVMIESSESDDEADETSNMNVVPNTKDAIRQSGDGGQRLGGGGNP